MERALVKRLYRDEKSQETVMLMESTESKERIKVAVPCEKAGVLALEAHGLNDRCPLYVMFSQCIEQLGAAFGAVVIACEEPECPRGAISITRGGSVTWIGADVVELVAFAMHARIPIYVTKPDGPAEDAGFRRNNANTKIPSVFADALEDILSAGTDAKPRPTDNLD